MVFWEFKILQRKQNYFYGQDVRSYRMTLRTGQDILIWRRRLWIALYGGIVLEEALDLSSDRILNEWGLITVMTNFPDIIGLSEQQYSAINLTGLKVLIITSRQILCIFGNICLLSGEMTDIPLNLIMMETIWPSHVKLQRLVLHTLRVFSLTNARMTCILIFSHLIPYLSSVSNSDFLNAMWCLHPSKSGGFDGISSFIIKGCSDVLILVFKFNNKNNNNIY